MDRKKHLSYELIKNFVNGEVTLEPHEFRHFQDCDQCSSTWWELKQEANRRRGDQNKDEKSA